MGLTPFIKKVWGAGRAGGTPYTSADTNRWEQGIADARAITDSYQRIKRTANAAAANDYTTNNAGSLVVVDAANLALPMVCDGTTAVDLRLSVDIWHTVANASVFVGFMDSLNGGAAALVDGTVASAWSRPLAGAGFNFRHSIDYEFVPVAGNHVFLPAFGVSTAGTLTMAARANDPVVFSTRRLA